MSSAKKLFFSPITVSNFFLLFLFLNGSNCAKILCVIPFISPSHQLAFQPVWKLLSLSGHQLTVITPNPLNDPKFSNITEIDLSFSYSIIPRTDFTSLVSGNVYQTLTFMTDFGLKLVEEQFGDVSIQNFLNDKSQEFDLVIVQLSFLYNLANMGFAARFKAPIIAISSLGVFLHSHDALGNPTHPVVSPDMMLNFSGELSFFDRVDSLLFQFWYRILYYWYALPKADRIARKYFGNDMPYLGDIEKNISLMMLNVNPIIHTVRPNVPNVIEINQMHIREKKPLPKELKTYLDSSTQGVVYFSLGSNVKSANLTTHVKEIIIGALGELPYNVLWKFEADYLPGQPDNVMIRKWLPQQDILGHPNVKVFVTQGGLQSIEEAITNETPMVGMPFITDQPSNIKKLVELGMGLAVDYKSMTKDELKKVIIEVAEHKKYKKSVQKSKSILVDQPMKGVDKAVWWIEYVIRHKGAAHLRSPAADMSFIQYFMVDVLIFLLVCSSLSLYCVMKIVHFGKKLAGHSKKLKEN